MAAIGVNWAEIWQPVWGAVWDDAPAVTVPNVVGLSETAATVAIEAEGLVVAVSSAYSSTVAVGDVISQSPAAGTSVLSGSGVAIVVSLGVQASDATGGFWVDYPMPPRRRKIKDDEPEEEKQPDPVAESLDAIAIVKPPRKSKTYRLPRKADIGKAIADQIEREAEARTKRARAIRQDDEYLLLM